jgi:hypothetical protein
VYRPAIGSRSRNSPGVEMARTSLISSGDFIARQYSGMFQSMPGAPTLTGQLTLPVT